MNKTNLPFKRLKNTFTMFKTAKNLNIQIMTVEEIAIKMLPTKENELNLPHGFARTLRELLQSEKKPTCRYIISIPDTKS
jgi:hypothetical protein